MLDKLTCPKREGGCGRQFRPERRSTRKFCYECRPSKVQRGPASMTGAPAAADPVPVLPGEMELAVVAELEAVGAERSVIGLLARRLARVLDHPGTGAAQVSALSAQLQRMMEPIAARTLRPPDPVDQIAAAVELKRRTA